MKRGSHSPFPGRLQPPLVAALGADLVAEQRSGSAVSLASRATRTLADFLARNGYRGSSEELRQPGAPEKLAAALASFDKNRDRFTLARLQLLVERIFELSWVETPPVSVPAPLKKTLAEALDVLLVAAAREALPLEVLRQRLLDALRAFASAHGLTALTANLEAETTAERSDEDLLTRLLERSYVPAGEGTVLRHTDRQAASLVEALGKRLEVTWTAEAAPDAPGAGPGSPLSYSVRSTFAPGDWVSHPTFGTGQVSRAEATRVDVAFDTGPRTLQHGRP